MQNRTLSFVSTAKAAALTVLLFGSAARSVSAQADLDWIGPDGALYNNAFNWSPNMIPGALDTAIFDQTTTYGVTFNQNTQTGGLTVGRDTVTLNLGGFTYNLLNGSDTVRVGVGISGSGQLFISNGTMTCNVMYPGASIPGVVTLTNGADVQVATAVSVGQFSQGTLNVFNGAQLTAAVFGVGSDASTSNTALVSNPGSMLHANALVEMYNGDLSIEDGGTVLSDSLINIATATTGSYASSITVQDLESTLVSGLSLEIGSSTYFGNTGLLYVVGGGTVNVDADLNLKATGTLTIDDGGTVNTWTFLNDGGMLNLLPGGEFNLLDDEGYVVIEPLGVFGDRLVLGFGVTPELLTIAGTVYIDPVSEVKLFADSFKPRRLVNDGTLSISGGNVVMGDPNEPGMYLGDGGLSVSNATFTIDSLNHAVLGYFSHIGSGTLIAPNGLLVPSGGILRFSATADALGRVRADAGSLIQASATCEIGDALAYDGFSSDGVLQIGSGFVTLHDRDWAVLGDLTELGNTFSGGTLHAPNGLLLLLGRTMFGHGSITADVLHHGHIDGVGPLPADALSLTGSVSGPGTFSGNVTFAASYAPGSSPAAIDLENATMSAASTLHMELGGLTPGLQHDQLNATGTVDLQGGALNVTFINGFDPTVDDTFDIINATTLLGSFGTETLPDGLVVHYEPDRVWLEMTSVCAWDADDDGLVGINDFLGILANWGPCGGGACAAFDSDDDGIVGINDFLAVLANWGACP